MRAAEARNQGCVTRLEAPDTPLPSILRALAKRVEARVERLDQSEETPVIPAPAARPTAELKPAPAAPNAPMAELGPSIAFIAKRAAPPRATTPATLATLI